MSVFSSKFWSFIIKRFTGKVNTRTSVFFNVLPGLFTTLGALGQPCVKQIYKPYAIDVRESPLINFVDHLCGTFT